MSAVASAPGRVNLIGEHTDYNDGFVLPVALPLKIAVEVSPRTDRAIHATSPRFGEDQVSLDEPARGRWIDRVAECARVVGLDRGFDARLASDVPAGAGLGSSGALAVAVLRALRDAFAIELDDVALAIAAQRSEHRASGARSGIMDQLAASVGREGEALYLDCRSLAYERVPLPVGADLVVIHSGVAHEHATGAYNERRRECEQAARLLGVPALRDVAVGALPRVEALPDPLSRRARHVVTEDQRVHDAVRALRAGDLAALGALLDSSHRSLRDDFEVSTPEVDLLVELVREQPGVHGARITGGGFGGSIVALADAGAGRHAAGVAVAEYEQRTARGARILLPPVT